MGTWSWGNLVDPSIWDRSDIQQKVVNPILYPTRRPQTIDWTDGFGCNVALTRGLWHNAAPGFKLGGGLAFIPMAVPIWLMGIPTPKVEDEDLQAEYTKIVEDHINDFRMIHLQSHRDATCWIWPFWSSKLGRDVWEFIPDDSICDIVRDIETGEVVKLFVDEELIVTVDYLTVAIVRRRKTYTKESLKVEWLGGNTALPGYFQTTEYANMLGIMPIPFANNRDGSEVRGHSDYERILTDLKNYHDTDLAMSQFLIKYKPKQVQYLSGDPAEWLYNNGYIASMSDTKRVREVDVAQDDFIINIMDKEKTEFIWPQGWHEALLGKMNQIFWKMVQASGIPELLWGTKVEGNLASADNQVDIVIQYIRDKQDQKNESYKKLFEATARLRALAKMSIIPDQKVEVEWNLLDMIPERIRAQIFSQFANGINTLVTAAGASKQMMLEMWRKFYPEIAPKDELEFNKGLSDMAKHKAFAAMQYEMMMDLNDWDKPDLEPVDETPDDVEPIEPGTPTPEKVPEPVGPTPDLVVPQYGKPSMTRARR